MTPKAWARWFARVCKAQGLRQDDMTGSLGVSENFLGKVERGGETVKWGKLFHVLDGLGVKVELDLPDELAPQVTPHLKAEK